MRCLALLMVLALGRGARPPRATLPGGGKAGWLSRRQAILGAVGGAAVLAAPRAAEASFGASRAAVVSPPTVKDTKDLDAEIFRNLDPKKRAQLQSILSTKQARFPGNGIGWAVPFRCAVWARLSRSMHVAD